MILQCSNPECGVDLAEGARFCGLCGASGQQKQEGETFSGKLVGDIGYIDGNINDNRSKSNASVSAINVHVGTQNGQFSNSGLVECPLCGRRNDEKNIFRCRECGIDHFCLDHLDRDHFICISCARKRKVQVVDKSADQEKLVLCPLCGKRNQLSATFKCLSCGQDNLCQYHQDSVEFICVQCVEVQAAKKEQEYSEQLKQQWLEAEKAFNAFLESGDIERAEMKWGDLQRLFQQDAEQFSADNLERFKSVLEKKKLEPVPGRNYTEPQTNIEMIWVPGGTFDMGDVYGDGYAEERPVHKVALDGFWIGKYPVTQGQYEQIRGKNPSGFKKGEEYPVENVSWKNTQKFISLLNKQCGGSMFRLPTEAEWEYAARSGGKKQKYAGSEDVELVGWYGDNSDGSTQPVGRKAANGLGIHDMSGNVREWCQDWYDEDYYNSSPVKNPQGPSSGSFRVIRGGSWLNNPRNLRSASRGRGGPDGRNRSLGFRLVLPVQQAR